MQLSEIKNDLATINYSPAVNKLLLSDFILIEDSNQSILAQIISIEATMEDDVNSAMLKFLLSIDKDANLTQYSGYVPAKNASLILINPEEVVQLIKGNEKNVQIGNLAAYKDIPVELSLDFLRKKTYIQVDFVENKLQIVETIIRGLEKNNKKTLLFDFQGLYEGISLPTVKLGYNFKLPLNYDALCYIAEEELNDFGNENKAIIQGILIEVQNYVKTMEDEFIPFETLISVLDAQYEESPMPELLLLKNKLLKYQQQGLFAQEKSEFDFLDTFLKDAKNFKFDLSELPFQWHKIAFASILNIIKTKCYLITDFSDDNSNKAIIKKLYEKSEIKPIVISSYDYKYQLQLKAMSKNLILFKPVQKVDDFAGYTSFLNILSQDTFIVWGEQTLFIPLILKIQSKNLIEAKIDNKLLSESNSYNNLENNVDSETEAFDDIVDNIITDDVIDGEKISGVQVDEKNIINENTEEEISDRNEEDDGIISESILEDESSYVDNINDEIDDFDDFSLNQLDDSTQDSYNDYQVDKSVNEDSVSEYEEDKIDNSQPENISLSSDNEVSDDLPTADDIDFFFNDENEPTEETPEYIETEEEEQTQNKDDLTNDENSQISEESVVENFENALINDEFHELDSQGSINDENFKDEPVEDFEDVVIDESLDDNSQISSDENIENETNNEFRNNITESVDTFAQENIDSNEETDEKPILSESPAVKIKQAELPAYNSNSAPQFDTKFAQGTYVYHQKYGRGVVEKVLTYNGKSGSKELCYIIFDSVGRRCLDPNLADIKQI